jgi:hypothetical protein
MNNEGEHPTSRILVLRDTEDDDGSVWRAVVHYADGCLAIQGFDTGAGVRRVHDADGHEFARDLSAAETARLRVLLGVAEGDDLLAAIAQRFTTTAELSEYLNEAGIPGTYAEWTHRDPPG